MEKFELEPKLCDEIRDRVFGDGFIKLVQSVRRGGSQFKISMRLVEIGGQTKFQAEMTDDGQVQVKNLDAAAAREGLEEILGQKGARELHLITTKGDLHVRVTKKGHALVSRSAEMNRTAVVHQHDHVKNLPLTAFDATAFLRVSGIADGEGRIKASMRGKYDQVNEFLKVVNETVGLFSAQQEKDGSAPRKFVAVDCGCGKAYLTVALYCYLSEVLKYPDVKVIGVDRRADVIAAANKMAESLDLTGRVVFVEADLTDFDLASVSPEGADLVVSLHACDTATDEALARGVEWKARYILSAPCCQHELQKRLAELSGRANAPSAPFAGLLRQSILRERLCDILTDSFRALILRILGFKVQVVEFVSSEATARNIMLKCEYCVKAGQPGPTSEYLELRDFWGAVPWLETRLSEKLGRYLDRFEQSK